MISYILAAVVGLCVVGADQYTKYFIASNYTIGETHDFLKGFIDITYIRNGGAAWGMLSGYTWLLISITVVVMLVCIALLFRYGSKNKFMFWAIVLVLSGGIGNMIDRIFRNGGVVDFLHFVFYPQFPVFNVADCAVTCGAVMFVIYFVADMISDDRKRRNAASQEANGDGNV